MKKCDSILYKKEYKTTLDLIVWYSLMIDKHHRKDFIEWRYVPHMSDVFKIHMNRSISK